MRKYLILLIVLCLQMAARGQTIISLDDIDLSGLPQPTQAKALRYWFDDDAASVKTASGTTGNYMLDIKDLTGGLHTLHYQIVDNSDVAGYVGSSLFFNTGSSFGTEIVKAQKLMYWFDDETSIHQTNIGEGVHMIDASALIDGLHTLHYQVLCTNGQMTSTMSTLFLRVSADFGSSVAKNLLYWFDDGQEATRTEITEGIQLLDASTLIEGLHTVHYQLEDTNGTLGAPYSSIFLKMNWDTLTTTAKALRYWYDDEPTAIETGIANGTQTLDATRLIDGLHTVHYQIVDSNGTPGAPYSSVFLKMDASASTVAKSLRYWFDDDASTVSTTSVAGGTQTLDVSGLLTGLHTLNYQLIDSNGKVGIPSTRLFMKNFNKVLADGHNRVTKYQYWLNTNSQTMQTVELDTAANPYTLIDLLPMQKEPIQSSQFHFEVTNDVPAIYAKNTLHVRFFDAQGYFTEGQKPFVDYSVKQEVETVGELQKTQTFPKVAENDIRWYTMQSAPGDTAAFKLSQAATLQVFAPSGKEVFKTSESASVQWGGIHTWEDGTYYVAVHDVTGSRSNMTLDYMHMDKYDVVDWDVHTVGNGGCSTITFKGNGFRDLYAVDLYTAAGDTIRSVDISHDSDAETSVTFDFSGAELGVYNAVFHFTQEDKHFANIVTVEEAVDIELATNVSFPSTFLRGTSTTYTIKITNNGNMTAYNVPLRTYIESKTKAGVSSINFEGLDLKSPSDMILMDSVPISDREEVERIFKSIDDSHYFINIHTTDANNDSIIVRSAYLFVTLPPNSTKTIKLSIAANETVDVWVTAEPDWFPLEVSNIDNTKSNGRLKARKKSMKDSYCCVKDAIECGISLAVSAADVASVATSAFALAQGGANPGADAAAAAVAVADCVAGMASNMYSWINTMVCEGETPLDNIKNNFNSKISVLNMILSCLGTLKVTGKVAKALMMGVGVDVVANDVGLNADCITKSSKKKPNCPPCETCPGGGSSTPQPPFDPNDIYGYLSDAGSKFMTDEVAKVNYTIEFENDTAFAQASAHTIVIRDTLDSRYFDLKSFLPTSVKIGEREAFLDEATDVKTSGSMTSFLKTIDMRPKINAIAQVEGEYSQQTGIAKWTFTSLDPMTMEPTDDLMQGILPVNYNGTSGIGQVMFEVGMKPNKGHGKEIKNRASIVFDYEEAILTPTWVNTVDAIRPVSHVSDVKMLNDSTATVSIEATDELSGPWRYNVYVQYGSGAWFLGAENVPIDTTASVKVYEGIDHGFYVVVTDSAGNVEQKEAAREFTFEVFGSQIDTDTQIELAQGWNWISHNQQEPLPVDALKPAGARMVGQTEELIDDQRLGWMGDLEELLPTQMYKLQMDEPLTVQLSGRLFNAGFRSVPLYEGWNWLGYPVAVTMSPSEALAKLEAEEGDMLIGQDGMAAYSDGQWAGTLLEMVPGQGYMFRSQSDKNLFYNATAQASSRRVHSSQFIVHSSEIPEGWTADKRKYPNVMGVIATLWHEDTMADNDGWLLAAFCGEECRGVAKAVDGVLMMNVYGQGGEPIMFRAMNYETGEVLDAAEQEQFRTAVVGTMVQPYQLHIGEATGVRTVTSQSRSTGRAVYDLQGRQLSDGQMKKGVYVVTGDKEGKTQKVIRK